MGRRRHRTPCEAGTRRARKTRWRQNRAQRFRGGNFSNRAALGVRPAGQAPRYRWRTHCSPPSRGGPGSRRHPSLPLTSRDGVWHQRERRAVSLRTSQLPLTPGRPASMLLPAGSLRRVNRAFPHHLPPRAVRDFPPPAESRAVGDSGSRASADCSRALWARLAGYSSSPCPGTE